jgi:hypothetical protein
MYVVFAIYLNSHTCFFFYKFRAEEIAMVKVDDATSDGGWIHEMITTFFETEWKLHGQEESRKMILVLINLLKILK